MKKIFTFVLAVFICCGALSACSNSQSSSDIVSESSESQSSKANEEQKPEVVLEQPPANHSYYFDSYEDVKKALTIQSSESFALIREEQTKFGNTYQKTLSAFASDEIKMVVPQLNGSNIKFRDKEGFQNITLFSAETYNLPWLWYYCVVDEYDLRVQVSYINILDNPKINAAKSYYEVLSLIAPNGPSPKTVDKFEGYKDIYEKEIKFADGRTETAMIYELKNRAEEYVLIYRDGMLIILYADSKLFSEDFWKSFNVVQY